MAAAKYWVCLLLCTLSLAIASCTASPSANPKSLDSPLTPAARVAGDSSTLAGAKLAEAKSTDAAEVDIDPELEAQVLAILRKHPQVVLDSLQTYQARQQQQQQAQQQAQQQLALRPLVEHPAAFIGSSPTLGASDRAFVLYEFSDFQCPFCAQVSPIVKEFMAQRGDEVTFVYKHFPLERIHPEAVPAAIAARAAQQQDKFWEYHDELFVRQKQLGEATYLAIAADLGLDRDRFNADRKQAEADVRLDVALGDRLGVRGTPFFVLNGIPLRGAPSVEQFDALLEQAKQDKA